MPEAEKKMGGIYVEKSGINHMTYYKKDAKWIGTNDSSTFAVTKPARDSSHQVEPFAGFGARIGSAFSL